MTNKFRNKYRISSTRLQIWDYSSDGMYYITICTKNRACFLGEIVNQKMILSEMGQIVHNEWVKTPEIRPDMNLKLGAFAIMPNHFHAILIITGRDAMRQSEPRRDAMDQSEPRRDAMHRVSTVCNQFAPQRKNLASIIRGFKSSVTTYARKNNIVFNWQPGFYDHIIRSTRDHERITNYIINNPANWHKGTQIQRTITGS